MVSSNSDAINATALGFMAATTGPPSWTEDSESLPSSMSESAIETPLVSEHGTSSDNSEQNFDAKQQPEEGGIKFDGAESDAIPGRAKASMHSHIDSVPIELPPDALLDENTRALSKEIDELFENLNNNFGTSEERGEIESDPFSSISNLTKDPGKEGDDSPSTLDQGTQQIIEEHASEFISTPETKFLRSQDIGPNSDVQDDAISNSVKETIPLQPAISTSPIRPAHRRNSSTSRRRPRHIYQMESISETGNGQTESKDEFEVEAGFVQDFFEQENPSEHSRLLNIDISNENVTQQDSHEAIASTTSSTFSAHTPRRRIRASGESATGSSGGNSISTGSGHASRGSSGTRRRRSRRHTGRSNPSTATSSNEEGDVSADGAGRRRRVSSSGSALSASLDAGMATLRRWIRARRLSFGSGANVPGAGGSSGHSVSSMSAMRLGEEDIFALSQTGSDPRRVTTTAVSTTSSDPNRNIFEANGNNGFLYYRPFEVHINDHDVDVESGIYGSDDESGTRSILLHPLVPSTESGSLDEAGSHQPRQRAFSEPDRARIVDFFSSVYGSRAIDGGHTQDGAVAVGRSRGGRALRQTRSRSSASLRPVVSTSPMIMEEDAYPTEQDRDPTLGDQTLATNDAEPTRQIILHPLSDIEQPDASTLESSDPTVLPFSASGTNAESVPGGGTETNNTPNNSNDVEGTPEVITPTEPDPNREARARWIRINRRFRCIITSVAVLFSLLLFCVLIAWVLLTSTYVLSHNKPCDVPLKGYFWLVTIQLMLDIFRADIMKWLCRWRTDSQRRIPPRVILYNLGYLIYAMLVLRMGVKSVFITESTCSSTAPELFYASLVFVCLSLVAWATILIGYLIPFCFVAVLLTRNGYFPNGDITSSRGVMGGRRARIGTGRISGIVGEVFPNTYSNPAPPGCVEQLRVVLLNEFPDSYQKECCICMMEYKDGEVIVATPCEHVFHKHCCQEWFQLSRTCPVCRTDVPEAMGYNEGTGSTVEERHSSMSESEETRVQTNDPGRNANNFLRRDDGRIEMNFMHALRREQRQRETTNHPESIAVTELQDIADMSTHSGRNNSQSDHQLPQQLDV